MASSRKRKKKKKKNQQPEQRQSVQVPLPKTVATVSQKEGARRTRKQESSLEGTAPVVEGSTTKFLDIVNRVFRSPFLFMIRVYQKTLSLDHGPMKMFFTYGYCRFHPSCSQYTYEAIRDRGVFTGILLGSWRILRCNPCAHGGVDPVPKKGFHRQTSKK